VLTVPPDLTHHRQRLGRSTRLTIHGPSSNAVTERDLAGARQLSNVLYDRITTNRNLSLDPIGDTYTDRAPTADDRRATVHHRPDPRRHTHRAELRTQTVEQPPRWALWTVKPEELRGGSTNHQISGEARGGDCDDW
jgi:hypothetical protein